MWITLSDVHVDMYDKTWDVTHSLQTEENRLSITMLDGVLVEVIKRLLSVEKELDALKAEHVELLQRLEEQ